MVGVVMFLAWGVSAIIKMITKMPRPFVALGEQNNLWVSANASFPSGHTTVFFALATIVFFYHKRTGVFFFLGALLIAIARVMVGAHYPIDVIVGGLIGVIIATFLLYCQHYLFPRKPVK